MLIIGTIDLTYRRGTGTFFCPSCSQSRSYIRRVKRKFLTVYFIPMIPLQQVETTIECSKCGARHDESIADLDEGSVRKIQRLRAHEAVRRVLIMIVAADDIVTDDELDVVRNYCRKYLETDVSADQILDQAAKVQELDHDLISFVRYIAGDLDSQQKQLLVRHAFMAATASGELGEARQQILKSLPAALAMPESEFRQVIAETLDQ